MQAKIKMLKERLNLSSEAKGILFEILLFTLAFALTPVRFLFGAYPFGIVLLGGAKRQAPFVFAGAVLSTLFFMEEKTVYVVALVAELGLRVASSFIKRADFVKAELGEKQGKKLTEALFCEGTELRVAVASLTALGLGIYTVISNGYVYYDIFAMVFNTVLVSIVTFCITGLMEEERGQRFLVGLGALLFCVAYALSGVELFGIDLVSFLSYGAVLYVSKSMGGIKSAALGVLLGVAQGGAMSGALGICGLVGGFLWGISSYLAIMSAFILSMGYTIGLMGYEAVTLLMPELLAASLVMYPLLKFEALPRPAPLQKKEVKGTRTYKIESSSHELRRKMAELSQAYYQVSSLLRGVGEKTKAPDKRGYLDMSLEMCESHCYTCPKQEICWKRDVETTNKNINRMGRALYNNGEVVKEDVDERFLHRCPNIDIIMEELNSKTKEIALSNVKNDKLESCAQSYEGVAKIIDHVFEGIKQAEVNKELTDKAVRVAAGCGFIADKIEVFNGASKEIIAAGVDIQRSKCTSEALRQEMERALSLSLNEAEILDEDGYVTLKMETRNNYTVETGCLTNTPDEESQNGDSYGVFTCGARQYMVICDGMGSGRDAHLTSELCVGLLKKMLAVSSDKNTVMAMLNSLVRAKNTECSSTVDLLELDLVSGEGRAVKSGACPSFVKRGEKVFKLQSRTVPLGIMKGLDAEELAFTVRAGDVYVMVSDGVVPSKQESHWLMQYLTDTKESDPDALARDIMREAQKRGTKDDMTVICGVIK